MSKKAKKRGLKSAAIVLTLVLVACAAGIAFCYREKIKTFIFGNETSESIVQICKDININSELAQLSSNGEILKIDYINPGLDTYTLSTVIYSLKKSDVISRTDFGTGNFATGILNNGFYVAQLNEGIINIYDLNGKKTSQIKIPSKYQPGFLSVSENGEYICFGDGPSAQIFVADKKMQNIERVADFTGYTRICDTDGSSFFVQLYENGIIQIDAKTLKTKKIKTSGYIRLAGAYGSISPNDDGFEISDATGKKTGNLKINKIDEIPVTMSLKRIITAAGNMDTDIITVYNRDDGKYFTQSVNGSVYSAVDMQNGYIALSTVKSGKTPEIYLIDTASQKLSGDQNQEDTAKTVSEKEKVTESEKKKAEHLLSDVPVISQHPSFPTGCESVSAVIAMRYSGDNISPESFIDDYLEKSSDFHSENGNKYGPDPYSVFIGSPRSRSAYGCMAPVIENAMNKYYQGRKTVKNLTGSELETLCNEYINNDIPCLVWASIGMIEPKYTRSWTLPDGTAYRWLANEHCMVLIGYDNTHYYFSDPYKGAFVKYEKTLCEKRFEAFGRQAIAILK